MWRQRKLFMHTSFAIKIIPRREKETSGYQLPEVGKKYRYSVIPGTVKYFSQKHLCQNEVQRRKVRRGLPSPAYLPCSVFRRRCQGCRFSGIHRSDRLRSRRPLTAAAGYATSCNFAFANAVGHVFHAKIPL